jgi:thiamine-phosphate pyrophosphorylase
VILCLVTDRRRVCASGGFDAARRSVVEQARYAVEAGVDLLQIRERDLEASELVSLAADVMRVAHGTTTRVIVNDRLDVALAAGADGVHLRADSVPASAARSIAPAGFLIGRSVHRLDEAVRVARDVDYLIAGTVFSTPSKPDGAPLLGVDGLSSIVAAVRVPLLAIGGISIERIGQIAEAGAAGVAAVGMFIGHRGETSCRATPLVGVAEAARRQFDSMKTAS